MVDRLADLGELAIVLERSSTKLVAKSVVCFDF